MLSKANWDETKRRWDSYWKRSVQGVPLMCIVAEKPGAVDPEVQASLKSRDMYDKYRDAARMAERYRVQPRHGVVYPVRGGVGGLSQAAL